LCVVGAVFCWCFRFVPSEPCRWRPPSLGLRFGCLAVVAQKSYVCKCFELTEWSFVAPLAVLTAQLPAGVGYSRLILLRNSRIIVVIRIVVACGCLAEGWGVRRSIQVVVTQVVLVACFDSFVFELVLFALLFHFFSVFRFWHRVIHGVEILDRLRCLPWWFVS